MDTRLELLKNWLVGELNLNIEGIRPASEDASFRRYFRVNSHGKTLIAMDAPPSKENSQQFVETAELLSQLGVHTPKLIAQDLKQGFLLLEDLGDIDYLTRLQQPQTASALYTDAIACLIKIQQGDINKVPTYSEAKLREEMGLFPDWYLARHLDIQLSPEQQAVWESTQQSIVNVCQQQPQVWVHRDYHSRNLMVADTDNPGVIDFQDLVSGPISYDLASIFKDCYIEWPRQRQLEWLGQYYQQLNPDSFSLEQLIRWYDITGFQRHLKVLGIFCRLNYRDGKQRYLADLPLVAKYCVEFLDLYPEFAEFSHHFRKQIERSL